MSDPIITLEERLQCHPRLKQSVEALIAIVEETSTERTTADEAELQVITELRRLGQELLHAWAVRQETRAVAAFRDQHAARGHGKKNCIGIRPLEKS